MSRMYVAGSGPMIMPNTPDYGLANALGGLNASMQQQKASDAAEQAAKDQAAQQEDTRQRQEALTYLALATQAHNLPPEIRQHVAENGPQNNPYWETASKLISGIPLTTEEKAHQADAENMLATAQGLKDKIPAALNTPGFATSGLYQQKFGAAAPKEVVSQAALGDATRQAATAPGQATPGTAGPSAPLPPDVQNALSAARTEAQLDPTGNQQLVTGESARQFNTELPMKQTESRARTAADYARANASTAEAGLRQAQTVNEKGAPAAAGAQNQALQDLAARRTALSNYPKEQQAALASAVQTTYGVRAAQNPKDQQNLIEMDKKADLIQTRIENLRSLAPEVLNSTLNQAAISQLINAHPSTIGQIWQGWVGKQVDPKVFQYAQEVLHTREDVMALRSFLGNSPVRSDRQFQTYLAQVPDASISTPEQLESRLAPLETTVNAIRGSQAGGFPSKVPSVASPRPIQGGGRGVGELPSAGPAQYKMTATGQDGHRIGSNDGTSWFDLATGQPIGGR